MCLVRRRGGAQAARRAARELAVFARVDPALRKSITFDNDTAFAQHARDAGGSACRKDRRRDHFGYASITSDRVRLQFDPRCSASMAHFARTEGGHWEGDLIICKRTRPVLVPP
jgi:IS30 family transposase